MAVTMQSIMETANKEKKYSFFVLHHDISSGTIANLREQISYYSNFSIDFINITKLIMNIDFFTKNRKNITIETYFRLFIPYLFSEYKKVIYLDCDMICCVDISEIHDIKLDNNLLVSSRDLFRIARYYRDNKKKCYTKRRLDYEIGISLLKNPNNYFLAGMLVFNTETFRETISISDLLNFATSKKWQYHDQDILNVLCEGRVLFLPYMWDFVCDDTNYQINFVPEFLKESYFSAKINPKIIHFATDQKPWTTLFHIPNFDKFWKYATRTQFLDIIIQRMLNNNFIISTSFEACIYNNIKYRKGLGLLFIAKCFCTWFFRVKK
jgi:lipopolysaccharide biosynthesis glycosyltransferase